VFAIFVETKHYTMYFIIISAIVIIAVAAARELKKEGFDQSVFTK